MFRIQVMKGRPTFERRIVEFSTEDELVSWMARTWRKEAPMQFRFTNGELIDNETHERVQERFFELREAELARSGKLRDRSRLFPSSTGLSRDSISGRGTTEVLMPDIPRPRM